MTPFRSLLVWRSQKIEKFQVPLIHKTQVVKVVLLDKFIEFGWLHFATFGKYYVGGWAKKDALYCVLPAYKKSLNGESFRVSYLTHEAQHFSDYKRFPKLSQTDLEYRAKLAELVAAKKTTRLLMKFRSEAKNDPKFPHSHAAWRVINDLNTKGSIQDEASRILREHSHALSSTLPRS